MVERSLCMRAVAGSIPVTSIFFIVSNPKTMHLLQRRMQGQTEVRGQLHFALQGIDAPKPASAQSPRVHSQRIYFPVPARRAYECPYHRLQDDGVRTRFCCSPPSHRRVRPQGPRARSPAGAPAVLSDGPLAHRLPCTTSWPLVGELSSFLLHSCGAS
jgi:hypothetical protein